MKKIFLTGVTGFLGQFLAVELLKAGYFLVFLAREKNGMTAEERVSQALAFVNRGVHTKYEGRYQVVEGSLDNLPKFEADEFYLVAGATSFAEKDKKAIFRANLDGTKNMLRLAKEMRISAVHYISTAYVCDKEQSVSYESATDCCRNYENPYAKSKCLAEMEILKFGRNNQCKVFVYRPSIIIPNGVDGRTTNFFGYLLFMYAFFRIGNVISKKSTNKDVFLPIWVPGDPYAEINLVHIDYVVKMMLLLREKNIPGIFHLTNDTPPLYGWLLQKSLKALNIQGPSSFNNPEKTPKEFRRFEWGITKGVEGYIPFVTGGVKFDKSLTEKILGADYYPHPMILENTINCILNFAIDCEFRREKALVL